MPLKIVIAPDKFKGTLTAAGAAAAIARGCRAGRPDDSLELMPISDGGEGFGEVMGRLLGAKLQTVPTVDAAHRPCQASWWWEPKSKTAVIESAQIIGLAMLPAGKSHPFDLDTFGLGEVLRVAAAKGARRCLVGLGGSATNDGGFGLACALGWKFFDHAGDLIERWTDLHRLARVGAPRRQRWFNELIVAVDVQNPLLGVRGATRVYGPQKGLKPADLAGAEKNLRRLARVMSREKAGFQAHPGAGAAGGLGFGLLTFLGARTVPGFDLFARQANLNERLRSVDLVLTGEGRLDASTFMGKGVGQMAQLCRARKIFCVALAGDISDRAQVARKFGQVYALTDLTSGAKAKSNPARWLQKLAEQVAVNCAGRQPKACDGK